MDKNTVSKFISLVLRHKPEAIGIQLDEYGWANVNELVLGIQKEYPQFDLLTLKQIVDNDSKQRYSFDDTETKIRANQGHSLNVDLNLVPVVPPDVLYHGTAEKFVESIDREGLVRKSRQYVHMSKDIDTAMKVGIRHGKPIIYIIKSGQMHFDGYKFFESNNGVWLTDKVPIKYLEKMIQPQIETQI